MSARRTLLLGWLLALVAIATFCRLGTWQLARMHEKQAMLDAVQHVLAVREPRPLALAADPAQAHGYDWAGGSGRFVDAPALLLDNQQRDDRNGVRVYRVFQPDADNAAPLLAELGWLPLPGDRKLPDVSRPLDEAHVAGLLAPPPSHGILGASLAPQSNGALLAAGFDLSALRAALHQPRLAPRVLKLDPKLPLGYARDLDILPNTLPPERHLGYAVQWFALALAVLVIALLLSFRKPKRKSTDTSPRQ